MATRTCTNCGALYESINPLRRLCDDCRQRQKEQRDLVVLAIADGELEANIWIDTLRQYDIPAMLHNTDPDSARFQTMPEPYSTEVLVRQRDVEKAREILDLDRR
jgi:hypothetical protein